MLSCSLSGSLSVLEGLTMSMTLRFPKEKAMALGGVATGSMKASEVAMVHGSITYSGCILMAVAWMKTKRKVRFTHMLNRQV